MTSPSPDSGNQNAECSSSAYDGSEPVFGTFMQTQVNLNAIRLTLDDQVVYSMFELGADIETTRRVFLHTGNVISALHDLRRIENGFESKVSSWEAEVAIRERNKRGKTGTEIAKLKAEVARVRAKVNLTRRTLSKLKIELHHIDAHDPELERETAKKISNEAIPGLETLLATSFNAGILNELIGEGMGLSYHAAKRMVVGQLGARENAWDPKLSVMLVAGWYPPKASQAKADHFEIRVWLIPKSIAATEGLLADFERFRLEVRIAGSLPVDLNWKVVEYGDELNPVSHSLQPFVARICKERFEPKQSVMKMLCASSKEVFWKNSSTQLAFRIL